ncbi:MAG: hypothetical protein K2M89_05240 [Clostridiales bacterium]|nr:hypothetical protein [Clostridiales bacterium]
MNNNNWTVEQTKELFKSCEAARKSGKSLSAAFRDISTRTGRSVNSVRNYYYGQAKTFELVPEVAAKLGIKVNGTMHDRFVPFSEAETDELIRNVLIAKGRGISVRKAILNLSGGDPKKALRLQNKYRSCLKSHRDKVERIVSELTAKHMPCQNPYGDSSDNFARLTEYIASLDERGAHKFLNLIEKLT